jgi:hypothetical protein
MTRTGIALGFVANLLLVLSALSASSAEIDAADETARLLAGLTPSASSPLQPLTRDPAWQLHERAMSISFQNLEQRQLSKIRTWSRANLKTPKSVLFYMFSGPDFLYADTFFPSASTYVLSGLEPVGQIPDLSKLGPGALAHGLNGLRYSLRSILSSSFFITSYMGHDLHASRLTGTMPILYIFLARTGHTIQEAQFVTLDENGDVSTSQGDDRPKGPRGIRIVFSGADHESRTLYYFRTDLADDKFTMGRLHASVKSLVKVTVSSKAHLMPCTEVIFLRCANSCSITVPPLFRTTPAFLSALTTRRNGSSSRSATTSDRSRFFRACISRN